MSEMICNGCQQCLGSLAARFCAQRALLLRTEERGQFLKEAFWLSDNRKCLSLLCSSPLAEEVRFTSLGSELQSAIYHHEREW